MPLLPSAYHAMPGLRGGHLQTILPVLLPRARPRWRAVEKLELPDGDFLELGWLRGGHGRLAVLSHGLEGSMDAIYMRGMAGTLARAGWDVLGWTFRGCGAEPNRLMRAYHSGESGDLRHVVAHAAAGYAKLALIGFSLGGNITFKYAGEAPPHPAVAAVAAVSAPVDLASSARVLDEKPDNGLYLRRFLKTLKEKTLAKSRRFPELARMLAGSDSVEAVRTIRAFDDRVTAPLNGFRDAEDYWARASSLPHLENLRVPALLLNARNDPLLAAASFPEEFARQSAEVHLEAPAHGGHVGFLDPRLGLQPWYERRVAEFLSAVVGA